MGNETGSKGYGYDNANRLTLEGNLSVPGQNGNIQYTWDSNGNPSASLRAGLTKKSIIGDGLTNYLYDANNQMTRLNDGVTLDFVNNGDGARLSKDDGTTVTKFVYDRRTGTRGLDPVLIETDNSGTTIANYTNTRTAGLLSQRRSSTTSWYHFEAISTSTFEAKNQKTCAGSLPSSDVSPNLTGGTKPAVHTITVKWNCCVGKDTSTRLIKISPQP